MSGRDISEVSCWKLASLLLQYPTAELYAGLDQLDDAAAQVTPRGSREPFRRLLGWLRATPPAEVAQHYVETFDLRRRCSLYLTYYRYGDTRERGMAMLTFKAAYRAAGLVPSEDELPDYLPMVLDFAAFAPEGERLLRAHHLDLALLHRALTAADTPYVSAVDAVRVPLPRLRARELTLLTRAWDDGPPAEQVGIEPFAPPQYMTGEQVRR